MEKVISKRTKIILGIITLGLVAVIFYQSYAIFKESRKLRFIWGVVEDFEQTPDIVINVFVDGEKQAKFPDKENYAFKEMSCTNSGNAEFDENAWQMAIKNITEPTECDIYFVTYVGENIIIDKNENMIAVMWNGTAWVKADETNKNKTYEWYDYKAQKWANIVLVTDTSRNTYKSATAGTVINENDILAYYVYVPRYKYLLWNAENGSSEPQEIKIYFENISISKSQGNKNGQWLTHPAFTFGTEELNGIWVGKFETSSNPTSECYLNSSAVNCDKTDGSIIPRIVPNVDSWRFINLGKMFDVAKYFKTNPMYGLSSSNMDAHMMKNMEWGAVAYLSHSKYGKWGNSDYSGVDKEIYINNVRGETPQYKIVTGCSGGSSIAVMTETCPSTNTYEKHLVGTGASTTGTIYGIYDMSGGAYEYVMGNMRDNNGNFYSNGAVFSTIPEIKYYDSYAYDASSNLTHGRGKIGDATKDTLVSFGETEFSGWYSDYSYFPFAAKNWFRRGGTAAIGANAGVFSFTRAAGITYYDSGFRVVLVR